MNRNNPDLQCKPPSTVYTSRLPYWRVSLCRGPELSNLSYAWNTYPNDYIYICICKYSTTSRMTTRRTELSIKVWTIYREINHQSGKSYEHQELHLHDHYHLNASSALVIVFFQLFFWIKLPFRDGAKLTSNFSPRPLEQPLALRFIYIFLLRELS